MASSKKVKVKKENLLGSGSEDGKNKKKRESGELDLPDPFGILTHKKLPVHDASSAIKFLMIYENFLLAIAARHIYAYDR